MAIPDFFIVVGSYVAVFLLATLVFNFLMAGFLKTYMIVKGSRGALVLVQVHNVARNYYRTGKVEDGFLVYKDANKHEKRLAIPPDVNLFYRALNVTCVTVDEERNIIILPGGQSVLGFDAEKYNSLYLRALYRPDIMNPKMQLMIVLGVITVILGVVTVITLNFVIGKKVSTMTQDLAVIKQHFLLLNTTII